MKVSFFGAAGEVTGSCTLVETGQARVLVDFGLHQGGQAAQDRNRTMPPIDAARLDAVVLTHAHVDHLGRLPLLAKAGYRGPIFATPATCDLAEIMLKDSAQVQASDFERLSRRRTLRGKPPLAPLYGMEEVEQVLKLMRPVGFGPSREIASGVSIRLVDSGHILGSASVEMTARSGGVDKVIAFSGDLGPTGVPLMNDPTPLTKADLVIMESTYGDRDHRPLGATLEEAAEILHDAIWAKQKVLVPAFAVGRTQLVIHYLGEFMATGRTPGFPVFLDSPMASKAMELYRKHVKTLDAHARDGMKRGEFSLDIPNLTCTCSKEESKAINDVPGAAVIIAGSGMCTGGRILHHLRHNLWRKDTHVFIMGFQAAGSLGRRLVEGQPMVRVLGENVPVRAKVHTLGGFSAHAGRTDLLAWAGHFATDAGGRLPGFVLNHGEDMPRLKLAEALKARGARSVEVPVFGQRIEL